MDNIFTMTNKEVGKLAGIVQATETKVGSLNYAKIQHYFKNIPECHHRDLEQAVQERNPERLGIVILMAIYQQVQDEVKDEHR